MPDVVDKSTKHAHSASEKYLFSYPSSSLGSLLSKDEYETHVSISEKPSAKLHASDYDLVSSSRKTKNQLSHSTSVGALNKNKNKSHYDEIPGEILSIKCNEEQIYAVINQSCESTLNVVDRKIHGRCSDVFSDETDHYAEIPAAQKIIGRKSKSFKERQTSEYDSKSTPSLVDNSKPKPILKSPPNEKVVKEKTDSLTRRIFSRTSSIFKSKQKPNVSDNQSYNPKTDFEQSVPDLMVPKSNPKSLNTVVEYARVNKARKSHSFSQGHRKPSITSEPLPEIPSKMWEGIYPPDRSENTDTTKHSLREEFKMYLLDPELASTPRGSMTSSQDSQEKQGQDKHENVDVQPKNKTFFEKDGNLRRETNVDVQDCAQSDNLDQKVSQIFNCEDKQDGVADEIVVQSQPDNVNCPEDQNFNQQGQLPYEMSCETDANDQQHDAESQRLLHLISHSSIASLYKLDYSASVKSSINSERNDTEDSMTLLNIDDHDLERFSNLSSCSSELDLQLTALQQNELLIPDCDLERFSTISTDSEEFTPQNLSTIYSGDSSPSCKDKNKKVSACNKVDCPQHFQIVKKLFGKSGATQVVKDNKAFQVRQNHQSTVPAFVIENYDCEPFRFKKGNSQSKDQNINEKPCIEILVKDHSIEKEKGNLSADRETMDFFTEPDSLKEFKQKRNYTTEPEPAFQNIYQESFPTDESDRDQIIGSHGLSPDGCQDQDTIDFVDLLNISKTEILNSFVDHTYVNLVSCHHKLADFGSCETDSTPCSVKCSTEDCIDNHDNKQETVNNENVESAIKKTETEVFVSKTQDIVDDSSEHEDNSCVCLIPQNKVYVSKTDEKEFDPHTFYQQNVSSKSGEHVSTKRFAHKLATECTIQRKETCGESGGVTKQDATIVSGNVKVDKAQNVYKPPFILYRTSSPINEIKKQTAPYTKENFVSQKQTSERDSNISTQYSKKQTNTKVTTPHSVSSGCSSSQRMTGHISNISFDSSLSIRNSSDEKQKSKMTPGVIHILNPCPSGWLEGGVKTKYKIGQQSCNSDKNESEHLQNVSVLDFDPSLMCTDIIIDNDEDARLAKPQCSEGQSTGECTRIQNKNIPDIANIHRAELLCKRVWNYKPKQRENAKLVDISNSDEQSEKDDNTDDFDVKINRGPGTCDDEQNCESHPENCSQTNDKCFNASSDKLSSHKSQTIETNHEVGCAKNSQGAISETAGFVSNNSAAADGHSVKIADMVGDMNIIDENSESSESSGTEDGEVEHTETIIDCTEMGTLEKSESNMFEDLLEKLESVGLGKVKLDVKNFSIQAREMKAVEHLEVIDSDSDSDSSFTETDSDSGDEVELASFDMPEITHHPGLDSSFDMYDKIFDYDTNHFAIDCSFEDVKAYHMPSDDFEDTDECAFLDSEVVSTKYSHLNPPDVIDNTPYRAGKSNLKARTKSEPNLIRRRVRFEENLPVYKSTQNLKTVQKVPFLDANEHEQMKKIEQFITCLFDVEPSKLGRRETDEVDDDHRVDNEKGEDSTNNVNMDEKVNDWTSCMEDYWSDSIESTGHPKIVKPVSSRGNRWRKAFQQTLNKRAEIEDDDYEVIQSPWPQGEVIADMSSVVIHKSKSPFLFTNFCCGKEEIQISKDDTGSWPDSLSESKPDSLSESIPEVNTTVSVKGISYENNDKSGTDQLEKDKMTAAGFPTNEAEKLLPRTSIARYTYTINESSDDESPKIKSVTYEYVTEYKLNNVKVHYQQNRKVQTDMTCQTDDHDRAREFKECTEKTPTAQFQDDSKTYGAEDRPRAYPIEPVIEKSICCPLGPFDPRANDIEPVIEKSIFYPLGPYDSRAKNIEPEIEKSICYPLGHTDGLPESWSVSVNGNSIDKLDHPIQSKVMEIFNVSDDGDKHTNEKVPVEKLPVKEDLIKKSVFYELLAEKPPNQYKAVAYSQHIVPETRVILEHNSETFVWSSSQAKIPFHTGLYENHEGSSDGVFSMNRGNINGD
ncbi:uncharacterized protein LOC127880260 [Dreissena polymorpha]|uniref:uncharacterized protein LOC127880260 n=1 Tax=Dreissena polymorpha TaxID=45954 RepID=UPI00226563E1|nr:uncharacterized protein LOC127880260 [Dreissena polymorpha]XP_052283543.1 uncharacterized protein LOC127880260 [Dreissena polymorpha]